MAGWPLPPASAASGNPACDILLKLQNAGFCLDLDAAKEDGYEDFSAVFDRVVSTFLREIHPGKEARVPVLLGDGRKVDLLKLYDAVGNKGGYDAVTESSGWAEMAVAAGFESGLGSSLKLVFFKYFYVLEKYLHRLSGKTPVRKQLEYETSSPLVVAGGISPAVLDLTVSCQTTPITSVNKDHFLSPVGKDGGRVNLGNGVKHDDGDEVVITGTRMENGGSNHLKRKREHLVGMLNWVRKLAMNPYSFIDKRLLSGKGKGKFRSSWEICMQAQRAREAMLLKRITRRNPDLSNLLEGHIYGNTNTIGLNTHNDDQYFQSISKKNISVTSAEMCRQNGDMDENDLVVAGKENNSTTFSLYFGGAASWLSAEEMQVSLGVRFQANVPAWTGRPSEHPNDSESLKWLGTRIWPNENDEITPIKDSGLIGKGRNDRCYCRQLSSVECIRFHITEKRLQLKRELGRAFYSWGFERMGEEVALSWTEEEQLKFKAIVHLNRPSLGKDFWEELQSYFSSKGTRNLVSYYFNVYLLGRRRHQNRVTPTNIDSDDDETEFGFLNIPFGHAAVKLREPEVFICSQNNQCEHSE